MKNIVLVTWIGGGNYGTSLQSFALHRKLELLGYNVSFLLKFPDRFRFKDNVKCILCKLGIDMNIIKKLIRPTKQSIKQKKLADFVSDNYNICEIHSQGDLSKLIEKTDAFVTGSDQIWNTAYSFNPFYFLDFAGESKKLLTLQVLDWKIFPKSISR